MPLPMSLTSTRQPQTWWRLLPRFRCRFCACATALKTFGWSCRDREHSSAVTRIRTWVVAATTQSTNHYTITADAGTRSKGRSKHKSHFFLLKIGKKSLPGGESNPGLPRDRRRYSPLYYRGWGTFWEQNSLLDSLLLPTTISRWIYRFSSDHRSQAASSLVSTWMGDRLGIPSVVGIFW